MVRVLFSLSLLRLATRRQKCEPIGATDVCVYAPFTGVTWTLYLKRILPSAAQHNVYNTCGVCTFGFTVRG